MGVGRLKRKGTCVHLIVLVQAFSTGVMSFHPLIETFLPNPGVFFGVLTGGGGGVGGYRHN